MQLQDYALGQMEYKTNLGYVERGCGTSHYDTLFSPIGTGLALNMVFYISVPAGLVCSPAENDIQSVCTEDINLLIIMMCMGCSGAFHLLPWDCWEKCVVSMQQQLILHCLQEACCLAIWYICMYVYLLLSGLLSVLLAELPVAINSATKATVAVPSIFKYPATLLCCGRKRTS